MISKILIIVFFDVCIEKIWNFVQWKFDDVRFRDKCSGDINKQKFKFTKEYRLTKNCKGDRNVHINKKNFQKA